MKNYELSIRYSSLFVLVSTSLLAITLPFTIRIVPMVVVAIGIFVCVMGFLYAPVFSGLINLKRFELVFEVSPVDHSSDLYFIVQRMVNKELMRLSYLLTYSYAVQENLRGTAKNIEATKGNTQGLAQDIKRNENSIKRMKDQFYTARDIALGHGFRVFESYKPYASAELVERLLNPRKKEFALFDGSKPIPLRDIRSLSGLSDLEKLASN